MPSQARGHGHRPRHSRIMGRPIMYDQIAAHHPTRSGGRFEGNIIIFFLEVTEVSSFLIQIIALVRTQ